MYIGVNDRIKDWWLSIDWAEEKFFVRHCQCWPKKKKILYNFYKLFYNEYRCK